MFRTVCPRQRKEANPPGVVVTAQRPALPQRKHMVLQHFDHIPSRQRQVVAIVLIAAAIAAGRWDVRVIGHDQELELLVRTEEGDRRLCRQSAYAIRLLHLQVG
eukprot:COSAG01_NODE_8096_length_2923_cov_2.742918_5_plen_103_part_01